MLFERPNLTLKLRPIVAKQRYEIARKRRRRVERKRYALKGRRLMADVGFEASLDAMIAEEWVRELSIEECEASALPTLAFGREFVETMRRWRNSWSQRRQVARVCALVACGRARASGREPRPLPADGDGDAPQLQRSDGALAWWCPLTMSPDGPRLLYWALPDGTIEFASVAVHGDWSIPGG